MSVTLIALSIGFVIGTLMAVLRIYGGRFLSPVAAVYSIVVRALPIKYTAVIFLIAVPDLMGKAKMVSSRYFAPISTYIIVALIYLVIVGLATLVLRPIGKRFETPGLERINGDPVKGDARQIPSIFSLP